MKPYWIYFVIAVLGTVVFCNVAIPEEPWWLIYVGIVSFIAAMRGGIQLEREREK